MSALLFVSLLERAVLFFVAVLTFHASAGLSLLCLSWMRSPCHTILSLTLKLLLFLSYLPCSFSLAIYCGFIFLSLAPLSLYHMSITAKGMTTNEEVRYMHPSDT